MVQGRRYLSSNVEFRDNHALTANSMFLKNDLRVERRVLNCGVKKSASFCIRAAMILGARDVSIFMGPNGTHKFAVLHGSPGLLTLCVVGCAMDFRAEVVLG
ncbi:hypothetical protein SASPL_127484 [Salvia splendens]|uniref:Uncharacterized protein n=1 Tax=Salvia splendens TaxID=180675 RepID=A0A8X8XC13_SALSN|nr:hypothetical protein SASPL_127484 [Salvia splendens]